MLGVLVEARATVRASIWGAGDVAGGAGGRAQRGQVLAGPGAAPFVYRVCCSKIRHHLFPVLAAPKGGCRHSITC